MPSLLVSTGSSLQHDEDIVIRPDRSEWWWKDEDELEAAVVNGNSRISIQ